MSLIRPSIVALLVCVAGASVAHAQRAAIPPPVPGPATAPPRPTSAPDADRGVVASGVNVRLEMSITDTYGGSPVKKVVSLLVADGGNGMIRTSRQVPREGEAGPGLVMLNLDAVVGWVKGDVIPVRVTFEYLPAAIEGKNAASLPGSISERISVGLRDGKPLVVSQSADPASDRKVTVELMATVVR